VIYLDTCVVIYAIEDTGRSGHITRSLLSDPTGEFAVSPLVVMEALVIPLRHGDTRAMDAYQDLFAGCSMIDVDLDAYVRAAELRAATPGLKTVDALHLAAAQLAGCSALWTNDRRLEAASAGLAIDVIGDEPAD
jgi:predicted nucleic acid-binding protein